MSIVLDGTTGITTPDISTTAQSTDITTTGDISAVDLTASGGVYLGGIAAANYLDDYEEGTFTSTIGYSTSITSATSADATTTVTASYIKIGKMVQVNFPYIERSTTFGGTSVVVFYMTVPFTCGTSVGPGVLLGNYNLTSRYQGTVFSTWIPRAQVTAGTNQMSVGSTSYNQTGGGYITLENYASGMSFGCVYIASA